MPSFTTQTKLHGSLSYPVYTLFWSHIYAFNSDFALKPDPQSSLAKYSVYLTTGQNKCKIRDISLKVRRNVKGVHVKNNI